MTNEELQKRIEDLELEIQIIKTQDSIKFEAHKAQRMAMEKDRERISELERVMHVVMEQMSGFMKETIHYDSQLLKVLGITREALEGGEEIYLDENLIALRKKK